MIKVLLISPYPKDANSLHRALGPMAYLEKQSEGEIKITLAEDEIGTKGISWETVQRYDAVFFHRPCRPDLDITVMKICKNLGIPIWVDYDDWLFEVPHWNPTAGVYNNPGIQNAVAAAIACADLVTVSTAALYDRFSRVNPNVVIIPNMYRSDLYRYREKGVRPRKSEYAWRGTNTHDADLWSVAEGFKKLKKPIRFYGGPFWLLLQNMKQGSFEVRGATDPLMYMRSLYEDAPRAMLIPLVDTFFNHTKSNIAYQEALHAGAVCIAPDLPEWRLPGIINYKAGDSDDFANAALTPLEWPEKIYNEYVESGWQEMLARYDAPLVNQIRHNALKALVSQDFKQNTRDPWDQLLPLWAMGQMLGKTLVPHGTSDANLKAAGIG